MKDALIMSFHIGVPVGRPRSRTAAKSGLSHGTLSTDSLLESMLKAGILSAAVTREGGLDLNLLRAQGLVG